MEPWFACLFLEEIIFVPYSLSLLFLPFLSCALVVEGTPCYWGRDCFWGVESTGFLLVCCHRVLKLV